MERADVTGAGGAARLVVFIDYVCPFCYLTEPALARLREEGIETEYRPYELRPAPVALLDSDSYGLRSAWQRSVEPLARALGVEIRFPPVQPRTRKAHEAAVFAHDRGRFAALHAAIFRAFFVEGRDIGRIDVLVELADAVGLDGAALGTALAVDRYTEQVLVDEREALEVGVTGVPTMVADGEWLVGLQRYEVLRDFARGGGAPVRTGP